jgi:penicillin-binding protein 2
VVAIEPATGEILAMVSAPYYNPGMLVGRARGSNYSQLLSDTLKPLFDRTLLAGYPPGSTFKVLNAMIALQEQSITLDTRFSCSGPESSPIRCTHNHVSPLGVVEAIRESCNPFMWNAFRSTIAKYPTAAEGYNVWREYVLSFGIGRKLDSDITNEYAGNIPTDEHYNHIYGERRWNAQTVRSLSIGQGEIEMTPLQLANYGAIVANRGWYVIPHVIKEIENDEIDRRFKTKIYTKISPENFEPVIEGMQMVVENTSAAYLMNIPEIEMCGKTGTVQNPHGEDHSVFMAFAPKNNPQIAIAVYVENSGFGSTYAAPVASLLVEKYLKGEIAESRKWVEKRMTEADLLHVY